MTIKEACEILKKYCDFLASNNEGEFTYRLSKLSNSPEEIKEAILNIAINNMGKSRLSKQALGFLGDSYGMLDIFVDDKTAGHLIDYENMIKQGKKPETKEQLETEDIYTYLKINFDLIVKAGAKKFRTLVNSKKRGY